MRENIKELDECDSEVDYLERINDAYYVWLEWLLSMVYGYKTRFSAWRDYYDSYKSDTTLWAMLMGYMVDYIRVVKEENVLLAAVGRFPTDAEKERLAELRGLDEKFEMFIDDVIRKEQVHCAEMKERHTKYGREKELIENMPYYDNIDAMVEGMRDIIKMDLTNTDKFSGIEFFDEEELDDFLSDLEPEAENKDKAVC